MAVYIAAVLYESHDESGARASWELNDRARGFSVCTSLEQSLPVQVQPDFSFAGPECNCKAQEAVRRRTKCSLQQQQKLWRCIEFEIAVRLPLHAQFIVRK